MKSYKHKWRNRQTLENCLSASTRGATVLPHNAVAPLTPQIFEINIYKYLERNSNRDMGSRLIRLFSIFELIFAIAPLV